MFRCVSKHLATIPTNGLAKDLCTGTAVVASSRNGFSESALSKTLGLVESWLWKKRWIEMKIEHMLYQNALLRVHWAKNKASFERNHYNYPRANHIILYCIILYYIKLFEIESCQTSAWLEYRTYFATIRQCNAGVTLRYQLLEGCRSVYGK